MSLLFYQNLLMLTCKLCCTLELAKICKAGKVEDIHIDFATLGIQS